MGDIKQKKIMAYEKEPIKVGDTLVIYKKCLNKYIESKDTVYVKVVQVIDEKSFIVTYEEYKNKKFSITKEDIVKKDTSNIGANPFDDEWQCKLHSYSYDIDSILFRLGAIDKYCKNEYDINGIIINELNVNPFIFDKNNEKVYYQRDYVWSINEKQELIDSIYKQVSCGAIIVRKRSWEFLEKMAQQNEKLYFYDIVDGKQRLACLVDFVNDRFTDKYNNYFSDLSDRAQRKFMSSMVFAFRALSEDATDADTLKAFIAINHGGVPCNYQHIENLNRVYDENFKTNIL